MSHLSALVTEHGIDVLNNELRATAIRYQLLGHSDPASTTIAVFYTAIIESSYFDDAGVLTFALELPTETEFAEYLHAIQIIDADDAVVITCATPKIPLTAGIGGMVTLKCDVTGTAGDILFQHGDYVTRAELTELYLPPKVDKTTEIVAGTGLSGGGDLSANRTLAVTYGTAAGTACQGNDSRLSNAREWTAEIVTQAEAEAGTATTARKWTAQRVRQAIEKVFAGRSIIAGTGLSGGGTLAADRTLSVTYGTTAGTAAQGNDARLSNAREWTAAVVTQAEAEAGTATTARKWTSQRVRQAVNAALAASPIGDNTASLATNGWWKDGSTGLIVQWGLARATDNTFIRTILPIAFPAAAVSLVAMPVSTSANSGSNVVSTYGDFVSLSEITLTNSATFSVPSKSAFFIAIGY